MCSKNSINNICVDSAVCACCASWTIYCRSVVFMGMVSGPQSVVGATAEESGQSRERFEHHNPPGGWNCCWVYWFWPEDSAVFPPTAAGWRACEMGGWGHLQSWWFLSIEDCVRCPEGREVREVVKMQADIFQLCENMQIQVCSCK